MTEEEKIKAQNEALQKVKEAATEAANLAVKALKDAQEVEIKALKDAAISDKKALQDQHDALSLIVNNGNQTKKVKGLIEAIEDEKEAIEKSVKTKGSEHEFLVKADALRASVVGNADALDLINVGQLATRRLTMETLFNHIPVGTGSNGVVRYSDWDQATTVRAATAVAEGAAFPESTAKWATYTIALKKIGDSIPMSEELVYDAPRFASELRLFLLTNVALKVDTDLFTDLKASVPAYTAAASGITDASIYDLIVKVSESITVGGGSKYTPDFVCMNIADINKMRLKKDLYNNYVMPPFVDRNGNDVAGITICECNIVPPNEMIVGDRRFARIYEIPGIYVATGYNGTDFAEDMQTLKARRRFAFLIRTVDQTGFKKVASISAALTLLATP